MKKIRKALDEYNRYRGVEARAKLIFIDKDVMTLEFRGSFCETCGYYDWIEDMIYILEEYSIESEIIEIREVDDGAIAKIKYKERDKETT